VSNGGTRERFHVLRNGQLDRLATEHWAEQVEDFIPARIAHLFLFDGEKVEGYADLDGASGLIATAIQNLLGLDIVERLIADLGLLERRKRSEVKDPGSRRAADDVTERLTALERERQSLVQERASAANALDRACAALTMVEERYQREGGSVYERRKEIETAATNFEHRLSAAQKTIRELAGGAAPLLLVGPLLSSVAERDAEEARARRLQETLSVLEGEYHEILQLPEIASLSGAARSGLQARFQERLDQRRACVGQPMVLDLSPDTRAATITLLRTEAATIRQQLADAIKDERSIKKSLQEARNSLDAMPSEDTLASILEARTAAQAEVARLDSEQAQRSGAIEQLDRELQVLREKEARIAEADTRERFAQEDLQRVLSHSARARGTMGRFREAVVARHVERIERLVLESFHRLARKQHLITNLKIDPQTFRLELNGSDGASLTTDRLSAGERQILAVAILWGLARASGRPLPAVIDTPLGRLDAEHRSHLVRRYFPHASHQVLLLSTDEEIIGRYYEDLRPSIDRTYRLRFDPAAGRTVVETGYLEGLSRAH